MKQFFLLSSIFFITGLQAQEAYNGRKLLINNDQSVPAIKWKNISEAISNQELPIKKGAFCYHVYSNYMAVPDPQDTIDGNIFLYNFSSGVIKNLTYGLNVVNSMNPNFNRKGSEITFMAIPKDKASETTYNTDTKSYQRLRKNLEIYIYNFASKKLTRLTNNDVPDEDPKFSPDGNKIIFKQNGILKVMGISGNIIGTLRDNGYPISGSMPYFTLDGQKVLYAKGSGANSDIYIVDVDGDNNIALDAEPNIDEYYPIVRDSSTFLYTRWVSVYNKNDQIYLGYLSGGNNRLLINNDQTNFSDPAPVGSDYLLFSSTMGGGKGGYDIYLGQISTGNIWDLNVFGINSKLEDLGSSYTPVFRNLLITVKADPSKGGKIIGNGSFANGEKVILKAIPNSGYSFVNWTDEDGTVLSTDSVYSFIAKENKSLIAHFELNTGINSIVSNKKLLIFPNPTTGRFIVKAKQLREIYIINCDGKYIKHFIVKDNQIDINIGNLPKGIYLVRAMTDNGIIIEKIIHE